MNQRIALGLTLLAGVAIGATAIQGLHAQATPPTYFVADIGAITDPEGFKAVGPKAGPAAAAFAGKYVMRTENITAVKGTAPKRFVVIAFESLAKAQAWYASPAQKEVGAILDKTTTQTQFFVEGMAN